LGSISDVSPINRGGSNIAIVDSKAFVFGGFAGKQLNDFWSFDFKTDKWSSMETANSNELPEGRSVACGLRISNKSFFVFGGEKEASASGHEGAGLYFNNSFIFNLNDDKWKEVKTDLVPSARGWFGAASLDNEVFVFGGYNGKGRINDLWRFH